MNMNKSSTMSSNQKMFPLKLKIISKFNLHRMDYPNCFVEDNPRCRWTCKEAGRGWKRPSPLGFMGPPKNMFKPRRVISRRSPCLKMADRVSYTGYNQFQLSDASSDLLGPCTKFMLAEAKAEF